MIYTIHRDDGVGSEKANARCAEDPSERVPPPSADVLAYKPSMFKTDII